jgi:hypothetical protein
MHIKRKNCEGISNCGRPEQTRPCTKAIGHAPNGAPPIGFANDFLTIPNRIAACALIGRAPHGVPPIGLASDFFTFSNRIATWAPPLYTHFARRIW